MTRRGVETAVLLPVDEWRRLQRSSGRSLKDLLLAEEARFDDLVPAPGKRQRRAPLAVD